MSRKSPRPVRTRLNSRPGSRPAPRPGAPRLRAAAAGLAACLVVGLAPGSLPAASAADPGSGTSAEGVPAGVAAGRGDGRATVKLRLQGRGYGHGRGLSQWGAQGAAVQGESWRSIVRFYYPRTKLGSIGGKVSVWISGDSDRNTVVRTVRGLTARSLSSGRTIALTGKRPNAVAWRLRWAKGGSTEVAYRLRGGQWTRLRLLPGEVELSARKPIPLVTPGGTTRYRGTLRSTAENEGGRRRVTVNVLPLEKYLRGVVPSEVYTSWDADAIRAQAVAARTYAAFERSEPLSRAYQICDTTQCQVYGGADAEHPATDAAIKATGKVAVVRGGEPIFAQFSASNGGWTQGSSLPYQVDQRDPWDRWSGNPYNSWEVSFTGPELRSAFPGIGAIKRVKILARDGNGAWGGRVTSVRVVGGTGSRTMTGDDFRYLLGMRSTWFRKI
ncbi:SpoIID/LytB domain-containing protein [Nocardioides bruguierae]|uniref:SpoIID/LytB domain-containing protein n=1 Tax=Nocardioides bruguierae TaxID=2945102 RepID=A0A9X2IFR7_9ACTN|nr:SpoIID/LytB domain-containing protein [Nocardioides bruguierae]MCM0621308.1 SpoIID/LytB domain-containing protein [Nocardioides bruguierae]